MKWHQVIDEMLTAILAESGLVGIYGTAIRRAGSAPFMAPSLEWDLLGDTEGELWAPCIVQLDQWCTSQLALSQSEQRLRRMFHRELPTSYGSLLMWSEYEDGATLASPDRDGYFARAIRFRFTPLRDRYDPAPTL